MGKTDPSELDKLKPDKVRFTMFPVIVDETVDDESKESLTDAFGHAVKCTQMKITKHRKKTKVVKTKAFTMVRLSDEELSAGLEYLFRKATQEILQFENIKDINKVGVMKEEILYCSSRVLNKLVLVL